MSGMPIVAGGDTLSTVTGGEIASRQEPDWQTMTAEEKRLMREGPSVEVSPDKVTG